MPLLLRARDVVLHETSDPQVIVAEWDYDGLVTTANCPFQVSNIQASRGPWGAGRGPGATGGAGAGLRWLGEVCGWGW
jgi:hypothetical protein